MAYQNPVPRLDGKKFLVKLAFDFSEWVDKDEAKASVENYIRENGIPDSAFSDITPIDEYNE